MIKFRVFSGFDDDSKLDRQLLTRFCNFFSSSRHGRDVSRNWTRDESKI